MDLYLQPERLGLMLKIEYASSRKTSLTLSGSYLFELGKNKFATIQFADSSVAGPVGLCHVVVDNQASYQMLVFLPSPMALPRFSRSMFLPIKMPFQPCDAAWWELTSRKDLS
ncbi:unnamed protein product [Microthlaspi erraticum]|uniref:Uncharacterized protein n=1 Tax=Microthlaspi erraticum TaxID=1685480 RepID=A0A6D2JE92_9BRAS|nr:unnamed protein product [Microthlaspi erraticum]